MILQNVLEQYAGLAMDRQHVLGEKLGSHEWGADTETGLFFFGGPNLESTFEIIGTVSQASGEWLWGWANASLPGDLAQIAHAIHAFGKAEGIDLFTCERFPVTPEDLHTLGVAACGLGGAKAYYIADYGDGTLLVALTGQYIMQDWQPEHSRIFSVFPRTLQHFDMDHKTALIHYLNALGYTVREADDVIAERDGKTVTAAFDSQGRLASLQGR